MTSPPSASTGPVIEWREREDGDSDAYVNGVSMGFVSPGPKRFRMFFGDDDGLSFETMDAARTACEAAIREWFKRAGWSQDAIVDGRRPGRFKLVYNKEKRTIDRVETAAALSPSLSPQVEGGAIDDHVLAKALRRQADGLRLKRGRQSLAYEELMSAADRLDALAASRAGWPELTDDMVVRAMACVPGCDHDDMVSALEAALGLPITDTRGAS